jgi:hypothetical protein
VVAVVFITLAGQPVTAQAATPLGAISTVCTMTSTSGSLTAGQSRRITGTLTQQSDGSPLAGRTLELRAQAFGESALSRIASDQTDAAGGADLGVVPEIRTTYRWRLKGSVDNAACESGTMFFAVRTRVAIDLKRANLHRGDTLLANGWTLPAKKDTKVSLWRRTATGPIRLASRKTDAKGKYSFAHVVHARGNWRVFIKIASGSGNLAGQSTTLTAKVS